MTQRGHRFDANDIDHYIEQLPIPAGAWRCAGIERQPDIATLGQCGEDLLCAFGNMKAATVRGRLFASQAFGLYVSLRAGTGAPTPKPPADLGG